MNNGIRYILASAVLLAAALCTDGYRASAQESSALSLGTVVRDPVRAAKGGAGTASISDVAYASMRNAMLPNERISPTGVNELMMKGAPTYITHPMMPITTMPITTVM